MSWLLLAVGLLTLGLGINVLRPSRSFLGMTISFLAEWLASELAHWTILVLGTVVALLASFGGLEHTVGWIGLIAACVGFVLLGIELYLGWRSGPTVVRDFVAAGLVDHMHLVQVPIVLGRGVRIWDGLEGLDDAYDVEAVSSPSGVTHLTFARKAVS